MSTTTVPLRQFQHFIARARLEVSCDRELLARFSAHRDGDAFAGIVERHGPMVLNLCRRIIGDRQLSEDAFQAVFLVLARRAGSLARPDSLSAWLYGTARRIALQARRSVRRHRTESLAETASSAIDPLTEISGRELIQMVEAEIARLPETYRLPLILCSLEGQSIEETARHLNSTPASVRNRLSRARKRLNLRLERRGLTLSAAFASMLAVPRVSVGSPLLEATIHMAAKAAVVSPAIASLAAGALTVAAKLKFACLAVVMIGFVALGSTMMPGAQSPDPPSKPAVITSPDETKKIVEVVPKKDIHGDALPEGAVARFGTLRHRAGDSHVAVTKDGRTIVTVGHDKTVRFWDVTTGELRQMRQLPNSTGWAGTYLSQSGARFLTMRHPATAESILVVWDLASGREIATLGMGKLHYLDGAAFSFDDRQIALVESQTNRAGFRLRIWDLKTNETRTLLERKSNETSHYFTPTAEFSPDGKKLLSLQIDNQLRCWNLEKDKILWEKRHLSPLFFFTPDSKQVLVANVFYNAVTGEKESAKIPTEYPKDLNDPLACPTPLGFSPDGRLLVYHTGKQGYLLWDLHEGKIAHHFPSNKPKTSELFMPPRLTNFAFTPNSKDFILNGDALQRFDLSSGKPAYEETWKWGHSGRISRILFSPNGKTLASTSDDRTARIWDVRSAKPTHVFRTIGDAYLAYTADSKSLLTHFDTFRLFDVRDGKESRRFDLPLEQDGTATDRLLASTNTREVQITSDGKKIVVLSFKNGRTGDECIMTTWNMETSKPLHHARMPWTETSKVLPDGRSVLALDWKETVIRLLDVETGKERLRFQTNQNRKTDQHPDEPEYALSSNGLWMASRFEIHDDKGANSFDDLRLFDMRTGRPIAKLKPKGPAHFAFSKDDRLFAFADAEGIHLHEAETWKPIGLIPAHNRNAIPLETAFATDVDFSPDGRTIATGHIDSTIVLWDVRTASGTAGKPVVDADRDALWSDLGGGDAAKAYKSLWRLVDAPTHAVALIRDRIKPAQPLSDREKQWIAQLDSDSFKTRETASKQLSEIGDRAESKLRSALKDQVSAEMRGRIESLLKNLEGPPNGEALRKWRALYILERIGSAETREVLEELANGAEFARLTRDAKAALNRSANRP